MVFRGLIDRMSNGINVSEGSGMGFYGEVDDGVSLWRSRIRGECDDEHAVL